MRLTRRELQLILLVHKGLSNKEIGFRLNLTEKTTNVYISHLYRKFDCVGKSARVNLALHVERNKQKLEDALVILTRHENG